MELEGIDRRQYERIRPDPDSSIIIDKKQTKPLRDISLGGLCFYSDNHYAVGRDISLGNRLFHVAARVIGCTPASPGAGHSLYRHTVRCEFAATPQRMQEQMLMDYAVRGMGAFAANQSA